jgi:integrase/recombinase XerC
LKHLIDAYAPTPLHRLNTAQLLTYLGRDGWAPETRRSARNAVRSYFKWAEQSGLVRHNPALQLPAIRVPAGKPRPTPDQVLVDALAGAQPRERLLVMFAAYAGLRRAEIAKIHTCDIGEGALRVMGKGGRVRVVPLHPAIADELREHILETGYMFPGQIDGHISPGHVGVLIKRTLGSGWSAHTLRHRFASKAYAVQRDLLAVQELLGHSKPETTRRYTQVPDGAVRAAVFGI